jgi:hypothetical protein
VNRGGVSGYVDGGRRGEQRKVGSVRASVAPRDRSPRWRCRPQRRARGGDWRRLGTGWGCECGLRESKSQTGSVGIRRLVRVVRVGRVLVPGLLVRIWGTRLATVGVIRSISRRRRRSTGRVWRVGWVVGSRLGGGVDGSIGIGSRWRVATGGSWVWWWVARHRGGRGGCRGGRRGELGSLFQPPSAAGRTREQSARGVYVTRCPDPS